MSNNSIQLVQKIKKMPAIMMKSIANKIEKLIYNKDHEERKRKFDKLSKIEIDAPSPSKRKQKENPVPAIENMNAEKILEILKGYVDKYDKNAVYNFQAYAPKDIPSIDMIITPDTKKSFEQMKSKIQQLNVCYDKVSKSANSMEFIISANQGYIVNFCSKKLFKAAKEKGYVPEDVTNVHQFRLHLLGTVMSEAEASRKKKYYLLAMALPAVFYFFLVDGKYTINQSFMEKIAKTIIDWSETIVEGVQNGKQGYWFDAAKNLPKQLIKALPQTICDAFGSSSISRNRLANTENTIVISNARTSNPTSNPTPQTSSRSNMPVAPRQDEDIHKI